MDEALKRPNCWKHSSKVNMRIKKLQKLFRWSTFSVEEDDIKPCFHYQLLGAASLGKRSSLFQARCVTAAPPVTVSLSAHLQMLIKRHGLSLRGR